VNRAKDKGTWAESAVAYFLQVNGWPSAERRALKGNKDRGDIAGTPGLCWEVKYTSGRMDVRAWVSQLQTETVNSGADLGVLVIKPPGIGETRVGSWHAVMPWLPFRSLLVDVAAQHRLLLRHDQPVPQSAKAMMNLRVRSDSFAYQAMYRPGRRDHLESHNAVMRLRDMTALLRLRGYGTPLPIEE
jgi:hypothetical protein